MRKIVLIRGIPASGKSTWIEENGLKQFVISPDEIRLQIQSPVMTLDGKLGIAQSNDKAVWKRVSKLIEEKMNRGEFIVVDATHSKKEDIKRYKKVASENRYRIYVVDFSDIPLELALERNSKRDAYKFVPENVLHYMHERMIGTEIPSSLATVIHRDDFADEMQYHISDFSHYDKVHHIGDIHGCNTVLQEYLSEGIKENELYIYTGDYVDRGIENKEVMEFLISIMKLPNVIFLEGNHERHLWRYATKKYIESKQFRNFTEREIESIDMSDIREFYRNIHQAIIYDYNGKRIFVNHGGLPNIPENMLHISTKQLIYGVGKYEDSDKVAEYFNNNTSENVYQIHGHRNVKDSPIRNGRVFNVCDEIERGGYLRVVTLDKNGFDEHKIKNTVYRKKEDMIEYAPINPSITEIMKQFDSNPHLINRFVDDDNIISYGFSTRVFRTQLWNNITTKARGFFVHGDTKEVVSRSYEKFFNFSQTLETSLGYMQDSLQFPVKAYTKENGFLGMVGYNSVTDCIVPSSKSRTDSYHAELFNKIFSQYITSENHDEFKEYLKNENVSAVFEVIDHVNDPHIIKYDKSEIILLDLVNRTVEFGKKPYEDVVAFGKKFGIPVKELAYTLNDWDEFETWHNEINKKNWTHNGNHIEGFVVEDSDGFMYKEKLFFYTRWKNMRKVKDQLRSNKNGKCKRVSTGSLLTNEEINFYSWLNTVPVADLELDIVALRDMYYKQE